jgi:hypothetical protein
MPAEQISDLSVLGLVFAGCMAIMLLLLPRRWSPLPIVLMTCYMTFGQQVVAAGLHFTMLRLLVFVGCVRIIVRREFRRLEWLSLDSLMVVWVLVGTVTYTLLWGNVESLVNRLGWAYDALGLYFIFRFLLRDLRDVRHVCRIFAVALLPLAAAMVLEKLTGRNPFYIFGGVPEFTDVREGVLRCQGPFGHPILAGSFGAAWVPMFVGLWLQGGGQRLLAILGIASAGLITVLAGSSGPVAAMGAGILGCAMWPFRNSMKAARWGVAVVLVFLQVVMKAPVWFLFARVNIFSGSTGWHRANLIDRTIANFSDWWMLGTKDTMSWGVWAGDITNQFILQGVRGGIVTLILFTSIVVICFATLGRATRMMEGQSRRVQLLFWCTGATLFAHVVSFMSVSYFDQNVVNWYLLLAITATMATECRRAVRESFRKESAVVTSTRSVAEAGYVEARI